MAPLTIPNLRDPASLATGQQITVATRATIKTAIFEHVGSKLSLQSRAALEIDRADIGQQGEERGGAAER